MGVDFCNNSFFQVFFVALPCFGKTTLYKKGVNHDILK